MRKLHLRFLSHFDRHKMKTRNLSLQESVYSKNHFLYNQQTALLMIRLDLRGPIPMFLNDTGLVLSTADLLIRTKFWLIEFV